MKRIIVTLILISAFGAVCFAQTFENPCPQIKVTGPQSLSRIGEAAQLNVEINKELEKYKIEYLWTASGGKITRGQGTPEIEVTPVPGDEGANITVTVKLNGLPKNCPDSGSESIVVAPPNIDPIFDSFGKLPKIELDGRLDNFFVAIMSDAAAEGLIVLEFDKTESRVKKIKRLNEILKHVNRRRFKSRLKFLISETDEEYTRFYVVPPGAKLTQVISESDLQNIIKGEELEQKIKELFPRKPKS